MGDLPLILRQAAQMGLFSSAALVRFLSMDVRPSMTRFVTRTLPPSVRGRLGPAAVRRCRAFCLGRALGCATLAATAGLHSRRTINKYSCCASPHSYPTAAGVSGGGGPADG